jgi:hypothetical protein
MSRPQNLRQTRVDIGTKGERTTMGLRWNCLRRVWASGSGSQLLEFALALPFLLVILIGMIDFGGAYNLKQNLTNAAREGARIAVSNPLTNATCSDPQPCSIEAAADAVSQYLTNPSSSRNGPKIAQPPQNQFSLSPSLHYILHES